MVGKTSTQAAQAEEEETAHARARTHTHTHTHTRYSRDRSPRCVRRRASPHRVAEISRSSDKFDLAGRSMKFKPTLARHASKRTLISVRARGKFGKQSALVLLVPPCPRRVTCRNYQIRYPFLGKFSSRHWARYEILRNSRSFAKANSHRFNFSSRNIPTTRNIISRLFNNFCQSFNLFQRRFAVRYQPLRVCSVSYSVETRGEKSNTRGHRFRVTTKRESYHGDENI